MGKGAISIYLVIIILIIVLMIAGVLSYTMITQMKMVGQTSLSVKAYQVADSGMEWALLARKEETNLGLTADNMCSGSNPTWFPVDNCSFCLEFNEAMDDIKSVGRCGKVRRAIRVQYGPQP